MKNVKRKITRNQKETKRKVGYNPTKDEESEINTDIKLEQNNQKIRQHFEKIKLLKNEDS